MACRLCRIWLRLALRGRPFPVEWRPDELLLLRDEELALTGGFGGGLPVEEARRLTDYLVAAAKGDPDGACTNLLACMRLGPGQEKADVLGRYSDRPCRFPTRAGRQGERRTVLATW